MHGGHLRAFVDWIGENKVFAAIAGLASIIGLIVAIAALR
jgi:hypothetical protein